MGLYIQHDDDDDDDDDDEHSPSQFREDYTISQYPVS